eukprot:4516745-Alexandrium_andersonii.AAC.1
MRPPLCKQSAAWSRSRQSPFLSSRADTHRPSARESGTLPASGRSSARPSAGAPPSPRRWGRTRGSTAPLPRN